jgi:hypothetical protein
MKQNHLVRAITATTAVLAATIVTAGSARAQGSADATAAATPAAAVRPVPPVAVDGQSPPAPARPGSRASRARAASAAPVFTGYLKCTDAYIYTDFTDPDGDDSRLNVQVLALRRSGSTWAATWLLNTGPTDDGVSFWLYGPDVLIQPGDISNYFFRAMDETGTWSGWIAADGRVDGTCELV